MTTLTFISVSLVLAFLLGVIYLVIRLLMRNDFDITTTSEPITELTINFTKLSPNAIPPTKAHNSENEMDAGFDLYCMEDVTINANVTKIDTGIAFEIPHGWFGMIVDKSGIASKNVETHGGIIDSTFHGSVQVMLKTDNEYKFLKGQKVAQIVFLPVPRVSLVEVDKLNETARGNGGFGSTGK